MNDRASPEGTHLEPPTLLPCPFCGGEAVFTYDGEDFPIIECKLNACGAAIQVSINDDDAARAEAARSWNRRTPRHFTKEELEAIAGGALALTGGSTPYSADTDIRLARILRAMRDSPKGGGT